MKATPCKCLPQAQKALKEHNTEIVTHFRMNGKMTPPSVATAKINSKSRQQAKTVLCSYCPFCGKKYSE